jgi:hypothetical protein
MPIHSYASVYALGHKAISDLFSGPVLLEEKVDGSQFSMSRSPEGILECRSKGAQLFVDAPEKMFTKAINTAMSLPLHEGWVYRCEYLEKPKHNTLVYSRVPKQHLIVFDICTGLEEYLSYEHMVDECDRIGLECVPCLYQGVVTDFDMFKTFLDRESILGGVKIEGVVVKNYKVFTQEKKIAIGKYVSEAFRETNSKNWKDSNPSGKDFVQLLIEKYKTEARWNKAIQHLRDAGKLEGSPRDIGLLIREVPEDILKEHEAEIRDALFKHFWDTIRRGVTAGLAEFYKEQLAKTAFPAGGTNEPNSYQIETVQ